MLDRFAAMLVTVCTVSISAAGSDDAASAAALRARYASHSAEIEKNRFGVPLDLQSEQTPDMLRGDVYALIEQPFDRTAAALTDASHWCDILILHPNVKKCLLQAGSAPSLLVHLGRKELPIRFSYEAAKTTDHLAVRLHAPTGPFETTDYRIQLEAAPMDSAHTILHLGYSHGYGLRAKLAMQLYFKTLARGKVGFTVVGKDAKGQPEYVTDLRGGLERNAMRYYASIESYLDALAVAPPQQLERRLRHWYAYTERYPLQLQEEPGYLDAKRKEAQRTH